jgi:hypothetical protein
MMSITVCDATVVVMQGPEVFASEGGSAADTRPAASTIAGSTFPATAQVCGCVWFMCFCDPTGAFDENLGPVSVCHCAAIYLVSCSKTVAAGLWANLLWFTWISDMHAAIRMPRLQVAFQQADYAAWNVWAAMCGRPLLPFR